MASWGFAPKTTNFSFSSLPQTVQIENGEPIRVWGIVISNAGTGTSLQISTQDASGTNLLTLTLGSRSNHVFDTKFIADKGLQFVSGGSGTASNIRVTVFHSHPGS